MYADTAAPLGQLTGLLYDKTSTTKEATEVEDLIFDLETDGLLDHVTKVHCLVLQRAGGGHPRSYYGSELYDGIQRLNAARSLVGHNIIAYDLPALRKLYPRTFTFTGAIQDTLVLARLFWADRKQADFKLGLHERQDFPRKLIGSNKLEAWGHRLGNYKGDFKGPWNEFTQEMLEYCIQDVSVTASLYSLLLEEARDYPPETIRLEHDVAAIIHRQEMRGIGFDTNAAVKLYSDLLRRKHDLNEALQAAFPPWEVLTPFTPKRANKTKGYVAGVTVMKREMVEFNPGSRDHIAGRLKAKYGWEPIELTETGKAKIDETVLIGLPYAEARLLSEFLTIGKLVGQLSEGRKSWLKSAKDGAIHSVVNTNGAVTGRMTHSEPNLAQVPRVGSFYGEECRSLFIARPGYVLVGADADALELRCLAGYMALYDGGEYIETVLRGDKALGTDIHSRNCRALGMEPKGFHPVEGKQVSGRDIAKTWFYAWLYGAGDHKLGATLGTTGTAQEVMQAGRKSRARFEKAIPGASTLVKKVQEALQKRGYLVGLDRRKLWGRSNHSALNTLLQSAGAVFMKRALHILDDSLQVEHFLVPGLDYEFVANVHDEWQIETLPDIAEEIGKSAVRAIKKAGEYYDFKCPLDGQFKVGSNWAKTH